jgi:hypothetical protein
MGAGYASPSPLYSRTGDAGAGGASLERGVFGTAREPIHGALREKHPVFHAPENAPLERVTAFRACGS